MLNKLKTEPTYNDKLVVIETNGTADIASVYDKDDMRIMAESANHDYAIPIGDVVPYVGATGRIYVLHGDSDYVQDTRRLAELEKSMVLRQVTMFDKERINDKKGLDIKQIMMYAMIAVLLLAVIFK